MAILLVELNRNGRFIPVCPRNGSRLSQPCPSLPFCFCFLGIFLAAKFLGLSQGEEILGVFEVFLGRFKKTKEKKDREGRFPFVLDSVRPKMFMFTGFQESAHLQTGFSAGLGLFGVGLPFVYIFHLLSAGLASFKCRFCLFRCRFCPL